MHENKYNFESMSACEHMLGAKHPLAESWLWALSSHEKEGLSAAPPLFCLLNKKKEQDKDNGEKPRAS